jgi:hypothetical protein
MERTRNAVNLTQSIITMLVGKQQQEGQAN